MSMSSKWTLSELRTVLQRELLDPNARWWGTAELNSYLSAWQDRVQDEYEFVWGSATETVTASTSTITLTDIATDIGRLDAVYWNNRRLVPKTKEALDMLDRNWRRSNYSTPYVVYQDDSLTASFWPPPAETGTAIFEYPKALTLASDTDTMGLPAWTRYNATSYGCFRSYLRFGPNQDLVRASRWKAKFQRQLKHFGSMKAQHLPDRYLSLRPGGQYEKEILQPEPPNTGLVVLSTIVVSAYYDETPTGAINGTNATFTLTYNPNPDSSLALYLDGVRLIQNTHYTLSTSTITVESAYIPHTGQTLFASYRYTS